MIDMANPKTWPGPYPVLPLARRNPREIWPEVGVLRKGGGSVVYLCLIHEATPDTLAQCEQIQYQTFDALKSAGWKID